MRYNQFRLCKKVPVIYDSNTEIKDEIYNTEEPSQLVPYHALLFEVTDLQSIEYVK